jgi:hypothetical protein
LRVDDQYPSATRDAPPLRSVERAAVVLGDLNDEPTAATTQIVLGCPGSQIGTPGFERPAKATARGCGTTPP